MIPLFLFYCVIVLFCLTLNCLIVYSLWTKCQNRAIRPYEDFDGIEATSEEGRI